MSRSRETTLPRQHSRAICPIAAYLGACWQAHLRRRAYKRATASLQALDDRMLKDLGIERSEIESVVAGRHNDPTRISRRR